MSQFDPAAFLSATTTEVNVKRPPLPTENPASSDGLYTAIIGDLGHRSGTIGKGDKIGQPWMQVTVPLKIEVPMELQQSMKMPPVVTLTDGVFIDLTAEGNMDNAPGKNRSQRQYRDATGLNNPGEPFSWAMVTGRPVKVKVSHEMYAGDVVERVGGVFKV